MIHTAKEYNLTFSPLITTKQTRRNLPIWFHPGRNPTREAPNHGTTVRCLQTVHHIFTVGQLQDLVANFPHDKVPKPDQEEEEDLCYCQRCEQMRANECPDPTKCYETAKHVLKSLKPKWNPDLQTIDPDEFKQATERAIGNLRKDKFDHIFPNGLSDYTKMENGYRLFTKKQTKWPDLQIKILPPHEMNLSQDEYFLEAATSGISNMEAKGGYGILTPNNQEISGKIPKDTPVNHLNALVLGTIWIVHQANLNTNIIIHTNSTALIETLTSRLHELENENWKNFKNREPIRVLLANLRTRRGLTILREHNENTNALKRTKAQEAAKASLNLALPERTQIADLDHNKVLGMKLQSATQASLYRAALEHDRANRPPQEKRATKQILNDIRNAAKSKLGSNPTDETIWTAIKSKNLNTKKLLAFLWKLANDALTPNSILARNPALAERAQCPKCEALEDDDHLFTSCHASGQKHVWPIVKQLLRKKKVNWNPPKKIGDILSCCLPNKKDKSPPNESEGKDRLRTILVAEAAWTIWVQRCKWRIEEEGNPNKIPTKAESENRFLYALNQKLTIDIMASDEIKYKKKAIPGDLSLNTWKDIVNNQELEKSIKYHKNNGVLVSMGPSRVSHPG
ncbi:hypothetical protein MD484_g6326, partial [Candolleomyces efflorescens]